MQWISKQEVILLFQPFLAAIWLNLRELLVMVFSSSFSWFLLLLVPGLTKTSLVRFLEEKRQKAHPSDGITH